MTPSVPKVSVIMSVYNDAIYLADAVASILEQSYTDFEVIIVNDGSTDETLRLLGTYTDPRIVVVEQKHRGLARSLNTALTLAKGRYVARQDADDISLPNRLATQVDFLDTHPDVALVGTGVMLIDIQKRPLRTFIYPQDHEMLCDWLTRVTNPLPHTTVMFRRDAVIALGGYDEAFEKAEDYALHLRLSEQFRLASIPEAFVLLRYRSDSMTFDDNRADLLQFALLARALTAVRRAYAPEFSTSSPGWPAFRRRVESWFRQSRMPRRFSAGRFRRLTEARWHGRNYLGALESLARAFLLDPAWFLRRTSHRGTATWTAETERRILAMAREVGVREHCGIA